MDELTLDGKKYLSSKHAAKVTGYAKDYVGQLCREGRVAARLVGRNWYVLESSILEHRFGAEDTDSTQNPGPPSPVHTWEAPRYTAESVQTVPEVAPKSVMAPPVPEEPNKVVLDMQSAWREWFEQQQKQPQSEPEAALPDAAEMLLADHEEPAMPTSEPAPAESVQDEIIEGSNEEPESNIHIERRQTFEPAYKPIYEEEPAPKVHIERIRPIEPRSMYVGTRSASSFMGERREASRAQARPKRLKTRRYRAKETSFAPHALLLSVAGLAIVVAIIGSGVADPFIPTHGIGTAVTNFFSGTQIIK